MTERWVPCELGLKDIFTGNYVSLVSDFGKLATDVRNALNGCGTTDAERAVIEAAETHESEFSTPRCFPELRFDVVGDQYRCACPVCVSVRALRAAREPKPRYWVEAFDLTRTNIDITHRVRSDREAVCYANRERCESIAAVLNAAERK